MAAEYVFWIPWYRAILVRRHWDKLGVPTEWRDEHSEKGIRIKPGFTEQFQELVKSHNAPYEVVNA